MTKSQKDWLEKLFVGMMCLRYVLAGLATALIAAIMLWCVITVLVCGSLLHNDQVCKLVTTLPIPTHIDIAKIVSSYKEKEYKDILSKQSPELHKESVANTKGPSYHLQCQEGSDYVVDRILVDAEYRKKVEKCLNSGKLWFECFSPIISPARDQESIYDETQVTLTWEELKKLGFNPNHFSREAFCN